LGIVQFDLRRIDVSTMQRDALECGGIAGLRKVEQGFGLLPVVFEIEGRHATSFRIAHRPRDGLKEGSIA
jgi:hypothetical protein